MNKADYHEFQPIHYAAMWGWTSTVSMLLEHGADINATNMTGRTPLMFAVDNMHLGTVK